MSERNQARILIADDEDSIRFVLREALESEGHTVVDVADGTAALEALEGEDFDLAFLDIRMPGASGLEVLERAQTQATETSVVIITAQSTFENAVEAMKLGALDYLTKPFGVAEVPGPRRAKAQRARARSRASSSELRREVGQKPARPAASAWSGKQRRRMLEVFKTIGKRRLA